MIVTSILVISSLGSVFQYVRLITATVFRPHQNHRSSFRRKRFSLHYVSYHTVSNLFRFGSSCYHSATPFLLAHSYPAIMNAFWAVRLFFSFCYDDASSVAAFTALSGHLGRTNSCHVVMGVEDTHRRRGRPRRCYTTNPTQLGQGKNKNNNDGSVNDQTIEALQALADFHEGAWEGQAKSFAVTADVAAGIVQRVDSPVYQTFTKLGLDVENRDFTMTETWQWNNGESDGDNESGTKVSSRQVSLQSGNVDVDAVDASYSLDQTLLTLPVDLVGSSKLAQFGIEHCVAVSDNARAKCWALYGVDGSLMRIVTSLEVRQQLQSKTRSSGTSNTDDSSLTAADLLEMQNDVDRLVDKITGNGDPSSETLPLTPQERLEQLNQHLADDKAQGDAIDLSLHPASLLELSAGVWLGDVIIRDHPQVPNTSKERGTGFGKDSSSNTKPVRSNRFGEWSVGVQKIAWRWMWNFGEEIRQVNDVGKAMGAELVSDLATSLAGNVCVNEGLSRRIPKNDRMVYVDWNGGNDVGFLVGSFAIQVPRYLTFERRGRPFSTEFAVFQSAPADSSDDGNAEEGNNDVTNLPNLVCSKSTRVYNFEGLLKQGCTSFFSFKRFGDAKE